MKNANRNMTLAAIAALALTVAPSALADMRIDVGFPLPPPPHRVIRHFPAPPLPVVEFRGEFGDRDGRYYDRDRYDDRWRRNEYRRYHNARYRDGWIWVPGHWVNGYPPGAAFISSYRGPYRYWVEGGWERCR